MNRTPRVPSLLIAFAALALTSLAAAPAATTSAAPFGDREILGVLQTVDAGEIQGAQSAQQRATTADVQVYAQEMIRDHRQGLAGVKAGVEAVGTTTTSALSHTLANDNKSAVERLAVMQGRAFDRAFVEAQVSMHQMVLHVIDNDLLPRAKASQVRDAVTSHRTTVAEHLQKAQELLKKVG